MHPDERRKKNEKIKKDHLFLAKMNKLRSGMSLSEVVLEEEELEAIMGVEKGCNVESDNGDEVVVLDYQGFADLLSTKPETLLNQSKRYEENAANKGLDFIKIGRGKKATYEVKRSELNKFQTPKQLADVLGFYPKYPSAMLDYIRWIAVEDGRKEYLTDEEAAEELGLDRKVVAKCRNELLEAGHMEALESQQDAKYYKHLDGEKEEISAEEFRRYWSRVYGKCLREADSFMYFTNGRYLNDEELKIHKKKALSRLIEEVGGMLTQAKARTLTQRFLKTLEDAGIIDT